MNVHFLADRDRKALAAPPVSTRVSGVEAEFELTVLIERLVTVAGAATRVTLACRVVRALLDDGTSSSRSSTASTSAVFFVVLRLGVFALRGGSETSSSSLPSAPSSSA